MNWETGHIANATGRESKNRLSLPFLLSCSFVFSRGQTRSNPQPPVLILPCPISRNSRVSRAKTFSPFCSLKNPDGHLLPSDVKHARNCTKLELTTPNDSQRHPIQSFVAAPPAPARQQAESRQNKVEQGKTSQYKAAREKINQENPTECDRPRSQRRDAHRNRSNERADRPHQPLLKFHTFHPLHLAATEDGRTPFQNALNLEPSAFHPKLSALWI